MEAWFESGGVNGPVEDAIPLLDPTSPREVTFAAAKTLLGIATPEAVLSAKAGLPNELLEDYFNVTEHFHFGKVVTPSRVENPEGSPLGPEEAAVLRCQYRAFQKSVVFTRVTSDITHNEGTGPEGAVRKESVFGDSCVAEMNFEDVKTKGECEAYLKAFADQGNTSCLLRCLPDYSSTVCFVQATPVKHW